MVEDELFALAPGEFVAARDSLAKRLEAAGERELARVVRALKRPTASAWAVNQLARRMPKEIERLLEAGRALREAEAEALRGGAGEPYLGAGRAEREIVAKLVRDAEATLARSGTRT